MAACTQAGAKLSKIDMGTVSKLFAAAHDSSLVDYIQMSKDLQMHYSSLNFVQQRITNVESLKQIMSKTGKSELKHLNPDELRQMISVYQSKADTDATPVAKIVQPGSTRSGNTLQSAQQKHQRRTM